MLCLFSSCATIFGGSTFYASIFVNNKPNTQIFVDGSFVGKGSAFIKYPRDKTFIIELRQEGCKPVKQIFDKTHRVGILMMNIFSFGVIGYLCDLSTGAAFKPDHKNNRAIYRRSYKHYIYTLDYSDCDLK